MNEQPRGGAWEVVKNTKPRIRHTMLRVRDLEKSIDFYTRLFGMTLFRRMDNEGGKYSVAFVGYDDENTHPAIELTYNWGQDDDYDKGDGFGHIAIGVPDLYALCEKLEAEGVDIPRPAGPLKHVGPNASPFGITTTDAGYCPKAGCRP